MLEGAPMEREAAAGPPAHLDRLSAQSRWPALTSLPVERARDEQAPRAQRPSKVKLTTLITPELRRRLRAALTATQPHEKDHSLNDLVVSLIEREVRRREELYNHGRPFEGGEWALIRGRKPAP
jgi:hypothetical protein